MSSFTELLTVTKISARKWKVEREFTYYVGTEEGKGITVHKGFETDFASVPRIFWIIFPPDGSYTQSAVLHDFLYYYKLYTRKRCDTIFLEAMGVLKVRWWKRRLIYRAVRLGGWWGWNKHRRNEHKETSEERRYGKIKRINDTTD